MKCDAHICCIQIFYFLGLTDRLKELLEDPRTSEMMRLPNVTDAPDPTAVIRDLYHTQGWYNHVVRGCGRVVEPLDVDGGPTDSDFGTAPIGGKNSVPLRRNIVVSLSADGFQPHRKVQLSLTPIVGMILNLPENLRHRSEYLPLIALVPGPKAPKSMNAYMQMVVDELLSLYRNGFDIEDPTILDDQRHPVTGRTVNVKVKLLFTCADYPAHCELNNQQGSSAVNGCIKCMIQVPITSHNYLHRAYTIVATPMIVTHDHACSHYLFRYDCVELYFDFPCTG